MVSVSLDVSAIPPQPAGAGQYVMELARALDRRPTTALTLVSRRDDRSRWLGVAPSSGVVAAAPTARPVRLAWERTRLSRVVSGLEVGVHHSPHYTMPARAPVPVVVTVHDLTFFDHPEWHEMSKVIVFRRAIRRAAHRADAIICVSSQTAAQLQRRLRPSGLVRVVSHGVDHDRFRPDEPEPGKDAEALARVGIEQPYVAFIGTLEPRKGVQVLVKAFDQVCGAHRGLALVVAGQPGWAASSVDAAIGAARHPARIKKLGYLPDPLVPALLRQAAAVAYPSLAEGFGLPALEALACGSPLVTTRGTAMHDVVEDAALVVDPGDVDELAGALDSLVRGDGALGTRRARGFEIAARYTWSASAEAHELVYSEVATAP